MYVYINIFIIFVNKMATYTSSLPNPLLQLLDEKAKQLQLPKNKIIERALELYLDQLNRAEYIKSYQQLSKDKDVLLLAEEGMETYLSQLEETEENGR